MFNPKLLVVAHVSAGSYEGGTAITSQVVEFNSTTQADVAAERIAAESTNMTIKVIKLY